MQNDVSGAQVLARCLSSQGIKMIFTMATPRLTPLINALENEDGVRIIRAHNETAAALMAEGYIRRSRMQAAVLTDANGRAISQICGVTNAWADKVPLVSLALCGDEAPDYNKSVERQRFDQRAAFQTVTRWNTRLTSIETISAQILKALQESCNHKMGPVHIDIPMGLLSMSIAENLAAIPETVMPDRPIEPVRLRGDAASVESAVEILMAAQKPLIFCGGGVKASEACPELLTFLETYKIPVATSMGGMGCVPISHPLCLGGPSYTAGEVFHVAIKDADVVLALGAAFSGLDGFGLPPLWSGSIKFIHVDIDPLQLGLNVQPAVSIQGDVKTVLGQLTEQLAKKNFQGNREWDPWKKMLGNLKRDRAARLDKDAETKGPLMHQAKFAKEVGKLVVRDDLLMVIDGGNTPLYLAMYAPDLGPLRAFYPFGMAALGGGIPYAIGAALAAPDKQVVLVTGDGSFMYNAQELETMRRLGLSIIIIINNDSAWNMIRSMQNSFFARNFVGTDLDGIEYVPIAEGFGIKAEKVLLAEDVIPAYDRARKNGGTNLIECITDKINTPDSLLSFALVEFDGVLKYLNPLKFLQSLWMMRDMGLWHNRYQLTYVIKALLRINLRARRS
jgi:acetolactate synthase-1/2/3 large subunit